MNEAVDDFLGRCRTCKKPYDICMCAQEEEDELYKDEFEE